MYLERAITPRLLSLLDNFPAVAITGARQVVKSTLLEHTLKGKAEFVVFDPVVDVENARRDPGLFLNNHGTPIVLDEIQHAPEILPLIKRRIDKNRKPGQYILTGSQQWGVLKSIAESLAGRIAFIDLEGFSLKEAGKRPQGQNWLTAWLESPSALIKNGIERLEGGHGLFQHLWRGGLPQACFLPLEVVSDFHQAYQRTYIERDARLLADVSDWQQFGRFMRLAAALTGQEINHSRFGREIGLTPQTSRRWLDILKATFQWFEVPAYSGNTVKRVSGKTKGYVSDTGVACWSLAISTPAAVSSHPNWGALFETAVFGELRKALSLLPFRPNVHHWRSSGGAEVDFLIERDGTFFPLEIKAGSAPSRKDVSGIAAFRKTYPNLRVEKGLVVCPCEKLIPLSENDYAMPWDAMAV